MGGTFHDIFGSIPDDAYRDGETIPVELHNVQTELRALAGAVRRWAPHIVQANSDELCFISDFLEHSVSWMEGYADEIVCPATSKILERGKGRGGFSYKAEALIRFIVMSSLVTDNETLPLLLRKALELVVPDTVLEFRLTKHVFVRFFLASSL